ncbi:hypothetical protein Anas_06264 [Armadillidium nasatum]|uniref:Uncharacterized protein n=1 Tax=Armadillidium nasatum TaxID=96803 RepID=A0A5N5TIW6_9CRUS|nr:hypothetical protein Anas_06264 [Armadillidium nasatum]
MLLGLRSFGLNPEGGWKPGGNPSNLIIILISGLPSGRRIKFKRNCLGSSGTCSPGGNPAYFLVVEDFHHREFVVVDQIAVVE